MKCPECQAEGIRSCVNVGRSMTTLMGWSPYYDEDGNYHSDNPNITTTEYSCSNGHKWTERRGGLR